MPEISLFMGIKIGMYYYEGDEELIIPLARPDDTILLFGLQFEFEEYDYFGISVQFFEARETVILISLNNTLPGFSQTSALPL